MKLLFINARSALRVGVYVVSDRHHKAKVPLPYAVADSTRVRTAQGALIVFLASLA